MLAYRDKFGLEISESRWTTLALDKFYKVVAQEYCGDLFISTIWTGVPNGPFGIYTFETVIFAPNEKSWRVDKVVETIRYETLGQAIRGHRDAIALHREEACVI